MRIFVRRADGGGRVGDGGGCGDADSIARRGAARSRRQAEQRQGGFVIS